MDNQRYINEITNKVEFLLKLSMIRPLMEITDPNHTFRIYRPVKNNELKEDNIPLPITKAIDFLLDTMLYNRVAYFAQFKKKSDLNLLKSLGYENPELVTFLIFKSDFDKLTKISKERFIIQQQLQSDIFNLN